jgi:hypothetical protein
MSSGNLSQNGCRDLRCLSSNRGAPSRAKTSIRRPSSVTRISTWREVRSARAPGHPNLSSGHLRSTRAPSLRARPGDRCPPRPLPGALPSGAMTWRLCRFAPRSSRKRHSLENQCSTPTTCSIQVLRPWVENGLVRKLFMPNCWPRVRTSRSARPVIRMKPIRCVDLLRAVPPEGQTIHAGHVVVGNDQVHRTAHKAAQRALPVCLEVDAPQSDFVQGVFDQSAADRHVVDHHDLQAVLQGHVLRSFFMCCSGCPMSGVATVRLRYLRA